MTEKLLPCPFCGGEAIICYTNDNHHNPYVECRFGVHQKPRCTARQYMWQYNTEEEAIAAWNRRAEPS